MARNSNREFWNQQQQALRGALLRADHPRTAVELFLNQHAMVHSAGMSQSGLWSFADEVWEGLTEAELRAIPAGGEHSMAWLIWHMARIEDVTLNLLVAGCPQLLHEEGWLGRLKAPVAHTGNGMDREAVAAFSSAVKVDALLAYRTAVGRRTREIVQALPAQEYKHKVQAARLQRVVAEGAVAPPAHDIVDYWGGLTIAGLLLMPPTRHNFVHLNEALRIRQKVH